MRGPALDVRPTGIESITPYWIRTSDEDYDPILATVPKPVVDVNEPTQIVDMDKDGTAIVVGSLVKNGSLQILLYQDVPRISKSVSGYSTEATGTLVYGSGLFIVSGTWRHLGYASANGRWIGPMRGLLFDTELTEDQTQAVIDWLMDGHYLDAPGTPIGKPELPAGNLNGVGRNYIPSFSDPRWTIDRIRGTVVDPYTLVNVRGALYHASPAIILLEVEPQTEYTLTAHTDNGRVGVAGWDFDQGASTGSILPYASGSSTRTFSTAANTGIRVEIGRCSQEQQDIRAWDFKLERGTEATAWTPAPEDDYDYWQDTEPDWEPDTSIWRTYLEVRDDGTYRYRAPTRIA